MECCESASNAATHRIRFESACEVFFDPLLLALDASVVDDARDAIIGETQKGNILFVVHIEAERETIRIISARSVTVAERKDYEDNA